MSYNIKRFGVAAEPRQGKDPQKIWGSECGGEFDVLYGTLDPAINVAINLLILYLKLSP